MTLVDCNNMGFCWKFLNEMKINKLLVYLVNKLLKIFFEFIPTMRKFQIKKKKNKYDSSVFRYKA